MIVDIEMAPNGFIINKKRDNIDNQYPGREIVELSIGIEPMNSRPNNVLLQCLKKDFAIQKKENTEMKVTSCEDKSDKEMIQHIQ